MIFQKQAYQQECIKNILDLLEHFDFKTQDNLKACLKDFYSTHSLAINDINDNLNIDILMETGTGKTFTYLKLIFELHLKYKQNKFIIFAPRKAILESIKQNIKLTKSYFYTLYQKYLKIYIYENTKSINNIINNYINNKDELSILILTNSAIDKKANILNKAHENQIFKEGFKSVFDNIATLKPISIIDEPHLLKGEAFNKYFGKIKALYFRFGATYPKDGEYKLSNVAYILDSISAFKNYLVKQIKVHSIIDNNDKLYLISTQGKKAKIAYTKNEIYKDAILGINDSLGALDTSLSPLSINNINKDKIYLNNGEIIQKANNYKLNNEEITKMISIAIDLHFKKERFLFDHGIKALSLFFIDRIEDFRGDKAYIRQTFEKLYKIKREEILKEDLKPAYMAYLEQDFKDNILRVHQGYFSGDSQAIKKENTKENIEANDIKMILKDKEALLSFDNPLRFIFSVWALQEGWDNPNISTIIKLSYTSSDISRHQQIGRGLRLYVDQSGLRMSKDVLKNDEEFFNINYLDILVSSQELRFIEELQKEIIDNSYSFSESILRPTDLIQLGLNPNQANKVLIKLEELNALNYDENNDNYIIITPLHEAIANPYFKELLKDKFDKVMKYFSPSTNNAKQISKASSNDDKIKIRYNLAKEFKDLWHTIHTKTTIKYENIDKNTLINNIIKSFNALNIPPELIKLESKRYDASSDTIIYENITQLGLKYHKLSDFKDILHHLAIACHLPLNFIYQFFNKLDKKHFINSPKKALKALENIIKEELHQSLISAVAYEFSEFCFGMDDNLYYANGEPKEYLLKSTLGKYIDDATPPEHYLYENIIYDSNIEKDTILKSPKNINDNSIIVYAKLPRFSIATPYKHYQPDFAYVLKDSKGQRVFFVCETKGYDDMKNISKEEKMKIDYARIFFKSLNERFKDIKIIFEDKINKQDLLDLLSKAING